MFTPEKEEEEKGRGKPNAWWAENSDTFGGSFRGTAPVPRGGQATVKPEDTLGTEDCWCSLPAGHDWPGKANGAPHPKRGTIMAEQITGGALAGYDEGHMMFIMHAVNTDGLRYQQNSKCITLYPPDGTTPKRVHKKADRQSLQTLASWYKTHVLSVVDTTVKVVKAAAPAPPITEPEEVAKAAARLAEAIGGVEHAAPKPPVVLDQGKKLREAAVEKEIRSPKPEAPSGWHPYVKPSDGEVSDYIETNGTVFRCGACAKTAKPNERVIEGTDSRAISGHYQIVHGGSRAKMHTPEAVEKRRLTRERRKLEATIRSTITTLSTAIGVEVGSGQMVKKVEDLEKKLAKATLERDEARTKLALIKETFSL